jgi:thiol-disulfide isomerase/thioredoxin
MISIVPQKRAALAAALLLAIASAFAQSAAPAAEPWYSKGLKELGFTVFPEPKDVGDFSARSLQGPSVKLSEQRGKIVLLNFWATWCPPCRAEMPALDALWSKTKDKPFTIMGVSVGEKSATVASFVSSNGYGYPIFLDESGALGSRFGARSIPTTYILDKSGKAIAGRIGGAPYDEPESIAFFAELASR